MTGMSAIVVSLVELPEEIQVEILSRIPAQHLGRCKCVSKSWLRLISSQHLVQLHLKKSSSMPTHLRKSSLVRYKTSRYYSTVTPYAFIGDRQEMEAKKIDFPRSSMGFMGTCDGLLCLYDEDYNNFCLWNPTTQTQQAIDIKIQLDEIKCNWFGRYDDEYTLVIGTKSHVHLIKPYRDYYHTCKSTQELQNNISRYHQKPGTLFNGSVHWPLLISESSRTWYHAIVSYDLRREMLGEIPVPERFFLAFTLGEVDGCLTAMLWFLGAFSLWAMKEYGVQKSWSELKVFHGFDEYYSMVQVKEDIMWLYHPATIWSSRDQVMLYVESLVSPPRRCTQSVKPRAL